MKGRFSILVCGGQDYYGPTANRDREVVRLAAQELYKHAPCVQVLTGGTPGIPDDFATEYARLGGTVIDIVPATYVATYYENTSHRPRPYIVLGDTMEERRRAFLTISNKDLRAALTIQGGKFSAHELELLEHHVARLVPFWGSGGASGGQVAYDDGYAYQATEKVWSRPYASKDPKASPLLIAQALIKDVLE